MVAIERIEHDGRLVAMVGGGRALIAGGLTADLDAVVRAKYLYALEVQAGRWPGSYTDAAAIDYARRALTRTCPTRPEAQRRR
jgi:hypothetical protein